VLSVAAPIDDSQFETSCQVGVRRAVSLPKMASSIPEGTG
jgi:hypothetical protein